jgi:hypothetical protein
MRMVIGKPVSFEGLRVVGQRNEVENPPPFKSGRSLIDFPCLHELPT